MLSVQTPREPQPQRSQHADRQPGCNQVRGSPFCCKEIVSTLFQSLFKRFNYVQLCSTIVSYCSLLFLASNVQTSNICIGSLQETLRLFLFLVSNALPTAFLEQVIRKFLVGSPWGHPVRHDICHILHARPWYVWPSSIPSHSKTTASSRSIELQQTLWCKVCKCPELYGHVYAICWCTLPPFCDTFTRPLYLHVCSNSYSFYVSIACLHCFSILSLLCFTQYSIISPQLPGFWRAPLRDSAQLLLGLRRNVFARSRVDVKSH